MQLVLLGAVKVTHRLKVQLLGPPVLEWKGQAVTVPARKSLLLLCLLALRQTSISREDAATLLWNGRLSNVRQALYQLRRLPGADGWLEVEGDSLALHAQTDVADFEQLVDAGDNQGALAVWRGRLVEGMDFSDAGELHSQFEEEALRLERLLRQALVNRTEELELTGSFQEALIVIERLLALDPLDEAALRTAMRLEFLLDRANAALKRYRNWKQQLERELSAEPQEQTRQLAEAIELGELPGVTGVQGLPDPLRQLVAAIQVGAGQLGVDDLAAVLRREAFEVAEGLETLNRIGMVDGQIQLRQLAPEAPPPALSELLEGRVAEVLEQREVGGHEQKLALARHWLQARKPERAAPWLLSGARAALLANRLADALAACFRASWTGTPRQRFEAMLVLDSICNRTGDDSLQAAALDEAAGLAWELQDDHALSKVQIGRARSFLRRKQNALALQYGEEALAIARRTGDHELKATAYNCLGAVQFSSGDLTAALSAFRECSELNVPGESVRALSNMGAIHGMRDEHDRAYELFEQALTLSRVAGDLVTVSACLNNLSASAERLGAYDRALKHLHEGRQLARRLGDRPLEAQLIHNLSIIYMRQGSYGPAWNTSWEVVEEGERAADLALQAQGLAQAADVAQRCGAYTRQKELLERTGLLLRELGDSRRLLTHEATLAVMDAAPHSRIPEQVKAVARFGMHTVYNWLLLELAMASDARDAGLGVLEEVDWVGPHQEFVADLARTRLLLLDPGDDDGSELERLAARLAQVVESSEFAEAALACQLLAQLTADRTDGPNIWPRHRDELLAEQVRGLPRDLAQSLRELPEAWFSSVRQG